jgi:hypothetical protein
MRQLATTFAVAAMVAIATAAYAQNNKNDVNPPPKPQAEQPQTTGQAVREAPIGHRQPTAKDLPPEISQKAPVLSPEDRALDDRLRICRGC